MKRLIAYGICLSLAFSALAQNEFALLGEDIKLRINADGSFGINSSDLTPAFYNEQNHNYLNQGGLWIYAEDDAGQIYTAVHYFRGKDSADIWPGPIDTLTGQTDPVAKWNKVWEIKEQDITNHRENYSAVGYEVPPSIADWPSNSENGFANYLAPFADVNANQIYDPENGDFPVIKGDNAVYIIANDVASEHTASLGLEIGLELHTLTYTYNQNPNSMFFDTYLICRKNKEYKNVRVGLFIGGECGNNTDNFGATLVNKNTITIYNGDDLDEGFFETNLPYVYGQFLNKDIVSSLFFENSTGNFNSIPKNNIDFGYYLNSRWLTGDLTTYGLDGNSGNTDYNFMFPRNSDPQVTYWSEEEENTIPGYRNGLVVAEQATFNKKDYIHLEYCIGAGNALSESEIFANLESATNKNIQMYRTTSRSNKSNLFPKLSIYPNPTNGKFTIENIENFNLQIINCQGDIVFNQENIINNEYTCNVQLASGVYYLKLMTKTQQIYQPLIVTH